MKTHNIYIAELAISTNVEYEGDVYDYIIGPGIKRSVSCKSLKYVLVRQKVKTYGDIEIKDLRTNKKYSLKLPMRSGQLFVTPETLYSFSSFYPTAKENLSKRKILKMGNDAIARLTQEKNK